MTCTGKADYYDNVACNNIIGRYVYSFTCNCACDDVGFTSDGVDCKSLASYT